MMQELEERIAKQHEGLAMELLAELKKQTKRWFSAFCIALFLEFATVIGFIWYLNQYDFTGSVVQKGVYTLLDSDGNVISADLTSEQIEKIMEIVNSGIPEND
jgi:hypothetical protein